MKEVVASFFLLISALTSCNYPSSADFVPLEFEVWGESSVPDQFLEDTIVQKIVWIADKKGVTASTLREPTSLEVDSIENLLESLQVHDLIIESGITKKKYRTNIPVYSTSEIEEAEKIAMSFAAKEFEILKKLLPEIRAEYQKLQIYSHFIWDEMAWIIIGAAISDLGVYDRVRFFPSNADEDYLPPLHPDGKRRQYTAYVRQNPRFKSKAFSFNQSFAHNERLGFAVFGISEPHGKRTGIGFDPIRLGFGNYGRILFSLSEGPLPVDSIIKRTGLTDDTIRVVLEKLTSFHPPAVIRLEDGSIKSNIPIIDRADFDAFLALTDKISGEIHKEITVPYAKKLGRRYPDGQLPRDISLKMLLEAGLLPAISEDTIPWNFGVWGWKGNLKIWEDNFN